MNLLIQIILKMILIIHLDLDFNMVSMWKSTCLTYVTVPNKLLASINVLLEETGSLYEL